MKERISKITQRWFLCEEALFVVFCTHRLVENSSIKCPIRTGKGLIEVNPKLCDNMTDIELEEYLLVEIIRILLKHPYERQPEGCSNLARALGSNCVIGDSYSLSCVDIDHPKDFRLPSKGHYEFYARAIQKMLPKSDDNDTSDDDDNNESGGGNNNDNKSTNDLAANWQQDELMSAQINETIRYLHTWGSLPNNLVEQIIASTKARVDYRKILAGFRASILSQARKLTRMRPNRRSGFDAMGSRYDFTTKMIIGVDVSGSIQKKDLQNFYTTINNFFKYGIQQIDVVQFDTALGDITTLDKASENIKITGRGGTNFQPFIDFVAKHHEYDGAIIYTDGYAPNPQIPHTMRTPLCWILRSENELKQHEECMRQSGRVCVIEND
jgi:predicted metal-dependent peptidase